MPEAFIEPDFTGAIDAKLDAQAILDKLPERLLLIAKKRVEGGRLTKAGQKYLERWHLKLIRD